MVRGQHTCTHCGYQKVHCQCGAHGNQEMTEMTKLEMQQRNLRNQYTKNQMEFNDYEYSRKLRENTTLQYSIATKETLSDYLIRLKTHIDLANRKNVRTHIHNNGRGCWFTHEDKFGVGCFMCEDHNLIYYLYSLIEIVSEKHPDLVILD